MLEKSRRIEITKEQLERAGKGEEVILVRGVPHRQITMVGYSIIGLNIDYFEEEPNKMTGTIKRKAPGKNFGFIRTEDGQELFFHAGTCIGDYNNFNEGDKVEFEANLNSPKGPRAEAVRKV